MGVAGRVDIRPVPAAFSTISERTPGNGMHLTCIVFLLVGFLLSSVQAEEESNDCHDQESWTEWDAEIKKD
jgi:hypothetical protein